MFSKRSICRGLALALAFTCTFGAAQAADEVNIYTARHYDTDEALYTEFTKRTGIKVNRIEDSSDKLLSRIQAEGRNSPADIFMTTDAGRLWRAEQAGILAPVNSEVLAATIPSAVRHPDGLWFGFSQRARLIFYDKDKVDPKLIQSYEDLARPELKGLVCTRSSSNIYMLSLLASIVEHDGPEKAEAWAKGVYGNRARDPEGGDTDQLKGIASGQCGVALANHYYFVRALRTDVRGLRNPEDTDRIGVVFPNQDGRGTHVNISGAGLVKTAPHPEAAVKFLEYLASEYAQKYFALGNNEFPVNKSAGLVDEVKDLGSFKADDLNVSALGVNQATAQQIYSKVGYK